MSFDINPEIFDAVQCPTVDDALAAIPLVGAHMLAAFHVAGEDGFSELRKRYTDACAVHAPTGTRARLMANMIWNMAEEQVRKAQTTVPCRGCHQKNRVKLAMHKATTPKCGRCGTVLYIEDSPEAQAGRKLRP